MFVPQLLEYKPQQNLEFPKYHIVPPPPPPPIRDTFGDPPLLTFQDYTTDNSDAQKTTLWHIRGPDQCFCSTAWAWGPPFGPLGLGAPGSPGPSRAHSSSMRAGSLGEREPARIPILTSFHKLHFPFVKPSNAKLRNCGNVEIKVSCILYPCWLFTVN
jgi:hypothetical protein